MSAVTLVRAEALDGGVPYAYAGVTAPGSLIFTAGACPLDEAGVVIACGDVAAQAQVVVTKLVTALRAAGAELADVAKSTVYVASDVRNAIYKLIPVR